MNFPPIVRAWLLLITLALSSGIGVGMTAFLGGATRGVAFLCGLGTAMTNVYHALAASPKDKVDAIETAKPFPKTNL